MPGDILIVDSVATNRIVLKVKLLAAQHKVRPCESIDAARSEIAARRPDLILLDTTADTDAALAFCKALKSGPDGPLVPVIATGGFADPEDRVRALRAGADDVLTRPFNDQTLQARIRSLLRARDASQELRLREDTRQALGFAEAGPAFETPAKVAVLSPDPVFLQTHRDTFSSLPNTRATTAPLGRSGALPDKLAVDLLLIDGRDLAREETQLYRLLSELRSHSDSRTAAILVVLPPEAHAASAMALDLGANDVVSAGVTTEEICLRCRALIADKKRVDCLRQTVRSGLEAAVTDPLTGLFNRRYAIPHLEKLAERARESDRQFAVMVLDIDHFKIINDTYGHAAGDDVLKQVADRLRGNVRAVDLLARIGGEEFLVAVPDSDSTHARVAAERLCQLIGGAPFFVGPDRIAVRVTASIGVSVSGGRGDTVTGVTSDLVEAADKALYAAKDSGRNSVSLSAA